MPFVCVCEGFVITPTIATISGVDPYGDRHGDNMNMLREPERITVRGCTSAGASVHVKSRTKYGQHLMRGLVCESDVCVFGHLSLVQRLGSSSFVRSWCCLTLHNNFQFRAFLLSSHFLGFCVSCSCRRVCGSPCLLFGLMSDVSLVVLLQVQLTLWLFVARMSFCSCCLILWVQFDTHLLRGCLPG